MLKHGVCKISLCKHLKRGLLLSMVHFGRVMYSAWGGGGLCLLVMLIVLRGK